MAWIEREAEKAKRKDKEKKGKWGSRVTDSTDNVIFDWIKAGILGIILFIFIRSFLFSSYEVDGNSMESTLSNGDKLLVNKIGYEFGSISRFDIIVFHANNGNDYVKRVIGLPGDDISYRQDRLYVNGEYIEEPYLHAAREPVLGQKSTGDFTLSDVTDSEKVPEGQLFVLGDNRINSLDSRHFGFVAIENVVGKVNIRYWPIEDFYLEL